REAFSGNGAPAIVVAVVEGAFVLGKRRREDNRGGQKPRGHEEGTPLKHDYGIVNQRTDVSWRSRTFTMRVHPHLDRDWGDRYKVKLVLPGNASEERKRILKAYGAEMVFSDPNESSDGAIRLVRQIYMDDPDRYFYPDQYNNAANWKAHFEGTGPEIINQTNGA